MIEGFAAFLTPEEYIAKCKNGLHEPLKVLQKRVTDNRKCEVCGSFNVWRLAGTDMCFTCTTGESDASLDYEIGQPY